ncbi:MAG: glycosyltransferase family 2 protein [Planctomycetota bacterium]
MTSPTPPLSVGMTVYNGQGYLRAALGSLLSQDFEDFELVAVDDGSTDATPDVLADAARQDERLRVVRQDNAGISAAANRMLAETRAPLIARMDADDLAKPGRLSAQVAFMNGPGSAVAASGCAVDYIDAKDRFLTTIRPPCDNEKIQSMLLGGHCAVWHTGSILRRSAVDKVGGYSTDLRYAIDLDLWLRLGEVGPLANLPESLQRYRMHAGGVSETKRDIQQEDARTAVRRAGERRGVEAVFEETPWRPGSDRASREAFHLKFGWWAYHSGQRKTAALYGLKAASVRPWSYRGWRMTLKAALGPPSPRVKRPPVPADQAASDGR